jgi:GH25 family lysozyme M1 (1,4-beta-N-acetylmuramidase)
MAKLTHPKGRTVEVPDESKGYYLSKGWAVDVVMAEEVEGIDIPDGDPSEDWSAKQLDAFAERAGIDLGGATKKADKVAAIAAAKA